MDRFSAVRLILVLAAGLCAVWLLGCSPTASPGLQVKDGKFYLGGKPYRGVGVNYYDLFTRMAAKPADDSSLAGLRELAAAGIPFVRFNAGGFTDKDWKIALADKDAHFAVMDRVVRTAEELGIGLIPSVFWTPALNRAMGERGEAWGTPSSATLAAMRVYTGELVRRYRGSPAIWAWEFGNEWNLKVDLPNAAEFRRPGEDARDDLKSGHLVTALRAFAAAVREFDTTRPLITGHSHPRAQAWHNTNKNSWDADSPEQWREMILRDNTDVFDTIGIHIYADTEANEACGKWATGWSDYLGRLRALASEKKLPVFIGEFGLADGGKRTPGEVKVRFREILDAMGEANIDMAAVWVFDLTNQSKTWNITFSNERSYMLSDVIDANREWNAAKQAAK